MYILYILVYIYIYMYTGSVGQAGNNACAETEERRSDGIRTPVLLYATAVDPLGARKRDKHTYPHP